MSVNQVVHSNPDILIAVESGLPWLNSTYVEYRAQMWNIAKEKLLTTCRFYARQSEWSVDYDRGWMVCGAERTPGVYPGEYMIRVCDLLKGKKLAEVKFDDYPAFSPDLFLIDHVGRTLLLAISGGSGDSSNIRAWEVSTGRKTLDFRVPWKSCCGAVHSAALSPNGRWIALGSNDGEAGVWDVRNGKQISSMYRIEKSPMEVVEFSHDDSMLLTLTPGAGQFHGQARMWDPHTGQLLSVLRGCGAEVGAFSPDDRFVALGCDDGTIRVYAVHIKDLINLARQRVTRELTCQERVKFLHEKIKCEK